MKIIKIDNDFVYIGLKEGGVLKRKVEFLNYNAKIGDSVELFGDEKECIVSKKPTNFGYLKNIDKKVIKKAETSNRTSLILKVTATVLSVIFLTVNILMIILMTHIPLHTVTPQNEIITNPALLFALCYFFTGVATQTAIVAAMFGFARIIDNTHSTNKILTQQEDDVNFID